MPNRLELHTLVPFQTPETTESHKTYKYMTRRETLDTFGGAEAVARRACVQVPEYMVSVDRVQFQGLWAVLTITIDFDRTPEPKISPDVQAVVDRVRSMTRNGW
jgi:hypothetical protein